MGVDLVLYPHNCFRVPGTPIIYRRQKMSLDQDTDLWGSIGAIPSVLSPPLWDETLASVYDEVGDTITAPSYLEDSPGCCARSTDPYGTPLRAVLVVSLAQTIEEHYEASDWPIPSNTEAALAWLKVIGRDHPSRMVTLWWC